jgi:class 3 adenylate cyclase
MDERQKLIQAIALQETLRGLVDDAVIDAAILVLREKVATLEVGKEEHQRKQVTIFFADLVDFMDLSSNLDPEEVSIIQEAYFQCCRRFIDHYGDK